jgi:hypothetical protein
MELSPHHHSGSRLTGFLNDKITVSHTKVLGTLREQIRKDALFKPISLHILATVHEEVLLPGMSMDVAVENDVPTLQSLLYHLFDTIYFRVLTRIRLHPLPVQVASREITSIVADHHTIWVKHRHNLENKVIPEVTSTFVIAD